MDELKERFSVLLSKINIEAKKKRAAELEKESSSPSFWQNHQSAAAKMKELSAIQKELEEIETIKLLIDKGNEREASELLQKLEVLLYLSGSYDQNNAIFSIHAGQGGVEAMDWAEMLFRMYSRFCEKRGWKIEVIDQSMGDEAGIKSVIFTVSGQYAYGYLKNEAGVHRLVRQSPFNADHLRQTSFAQVLVLPEISDTQTVEIKEDDLEWEFYRASSHGGQNVQKVSSAVRLKHKPTGTIVTCQTERYQNQNREYALKILRAKLWQLAEDKRRQEEVELRGEYKTPGWGNQIRSYVLHPYHMVKDLRSGFETSDTQGVLDGNIDGFIEAQLRTT
ncbi:peptide chain release factor 2 [Candidatus Microgenomates bacterium]|nr:peptide chain release factor 2 [Candidatus Microgenomates bacterium]